MSEDSHKEDSVAVERELPLKALVVMIVLAWALMLLGLLGWRCFPPAMMVLLTDGIMALVVLLAAGGYGYAIYRRLAPSDSPPALGLATAAALGLWLLSMAVLLLGSLPVRALTMYVWWPVIGGGVALALWQAHGPLGKARLPSKLGGDSLVWVIVAAGAGLWLAGALIPAGWLGNLSGMNPAMGLDWPGNVIRADADSAQLLTRHLQLPREFYQAGRVQALPHNVYSHHPLSMEMLQLLGMCLRGGAYQGMYLARLIGGLFAVLAVAAVAGSPPQETFRARAATALLATAPWVLYLAWLPMPELACLSYLTLGMLWLRQWMQRPEATTAACIGLMLGAGMGASYVAAGMLAAPLLLVMLAVTFRRPGRLAHVALAGGLAAAMFAPWAVRNAAATGNPLFPLATKQLGQGRWDNQTARRWRDAHALGARPPVPVPPEFSAPPRPTRRERFTAFVLGPGLTMRTFPGRPVPIHTVIGAGVLLVLLGTLFGMFARPRGPTAWDWALLGVLLIQMLLWILLTPNMPARTAAICIAPITLLCAGGLARLAGVKQVRWLRQTAGVGGRWGLAPAALLVIACAILNFMSARAYWAAETGKTSTALVGRPAAKLAERGREYLAANAAAKTGGLALIGEARAFYFPAGARYATAFDVHPLAESFRRSRSSSQLAQQLRSAGITHVYVAWARIEHLAQTVGWPTEMAKARLAELLADWPVVDEFHYTPETAPAEAATKPAARRTLIFTLYAVPPPAPATHTTPSG